MNLYTLLSDAGNAVTPESWGGIFAGVALVISAFGGIVAIFVKRDTKSTAAAVNHQGPDAPKLIERVASMEGRFGDHAAHTDKRFDRIEQGMRDILVRLEHLAAQGEARDVMDARYRDDGR